MKKQIVLLLFSLFISFSILAQESFNSSVFFETAKSDLTPQTQNDLTAFAEKLKTFGDYSLEIKAHTDNRGSHDYNLDLSNRRAESVINFLTKLGIESSKAVTESFGESRPDYSNDSEEGMSKNRRVELLGTVFSIQDLDALIAGLSDNDLQEYSFHSKQNVKLTAENGTSIWIPADAFLTEDGKKINGEITFRMQESYSHIDIIANGLSTLSGEKILETGGMVYMDAEANGQRLKLNKDVQLIVEMPTKTQKENMELFTGAPSDGWEPSDWNSTGQSFVSNATDYLKLPPMPRRYRTKHSLSTYNCEISYPKKPASPRQPIKPRAPKREHFRYNPGFIKTMTMGKKKINSIEEKKFEKATKDYQKSLKKYNEIRYPNYIAEKATYVEKLETYKQTVENLELECQEKKDKYYADRRKEIAKTDSLTSKEYKKQLAVWKKIKQQKIDDFENKFSSVGKINSKTLKSYFYQINQLGWINCDRFYDVSPQDRMEVMVNTEETSSDEMVYIAFDKIQSMIRVPRKLTGNYISKNLPRGESITIIGIKVEKGRPQMAMINTKIGEINNFTLNYKPGNLKEIRRTLEGLTES